MVVFGTYDVCVKIDSERLSEFDVEVDEEGKRVTCWIPSEAGKEFSVHYNNIVPLADGVSVKIIKLLLDGIRVASQSVKTHAGRNEEQYAFKRTHCGNGAYRKLLFAACQLTDEDDLLMESQARQLGEIEIQVYSAVEVERKPSAGKASSSRSGNLLPPLKVHERAKKGIVHGVQLGELILPAVTPTHKPSKWTSKRKEILATFVFRYRPLDMLQANGIAPRPPKAPTALVEPTDVIDLTLSDDEDREEDKDDVRDAEITALKARIEALERTRTQKQTQIAPTQKRVKAEEEEINPTIKRERLG